MKITISNANAKLAKLAKEKAALAVFPGLKKAHIKSFGIPAGKAASGRTVCPGAGACLSVCYARQGAYTWNAAVKVREGNLTVTDSSNFVDMVLDALPLSVRILRVHDSGDFHSQEYIEAWARIVACKPGVTFYAYTKSFAVGMDFDSLLRLPNFSLVFSEGSRDDSKIPMGQPRARIFSTVEDLLAAGYTDGSDSDLPAIMGVSKIGFVYHGVKKLSTAQAKHFATAI